VNDADQLIRHAILGGRDVAWSAVGSGPPLVVGGWWSSQLELDWQNAAFRHFVERLAEHRTVIRYDRPGTGLSDHSAPPATTLEEETETLTLLLNELGGTVDLLGASSGSMVAAGYAATNLGRVDHLVLYGGYAAGRDIAAPAARDALLEVVERHWGLGSKMLADIFLPGGSAPERADFAEFQRRSASREVAVASLRAVYDFDGTDLLPRVAVPTLVVHRRDDTAIPFALGRDVAARIPGAQFIELDGAEHFPWRGDADTLADVILRFLGVDVPDRPHQPGVAMSTADDPIATLSARELDVLRLIARGRTDREIAESLVLSAHTVHRHVANIRTKLGVPSRAAAAAWAADRRLI
jgi:pimeloyl-ACP methyl ester carboxylesterase/DNA-binding CsgD family transcriptional regulator